MSSEDTAHRKRNNYKLIVDPELQKGKKKLYRINGAIPGHPSIAAPTDPRVQKTVLGVAEYDFKLPVPRFKYDKFWEGSVPQRDVFVMGLTDPSQVDVLKEAASNIGPLYGVKLHRHPKTKAFLGAATIMYFQTGCGRKAVPEFDGKIVAGCYLRAELDDKGEHLRNFMDPFVKDLRRPTTDKKPGQLCTTTHSSTSTSNTSPHSGDVGNGTDANSSDVSTPRIPDTHPQRSNLFFSPSLSVQTSASLAESPSSTGCFSPSFTPCTPSSIDSGISLNKTSFDPMLALRSLNLLPPPQPKELQKTKPSSPSSSSSLPPLPPEGSSPVPPPPPSVDVRVENISSDEEDEKERLNGPAVSRVTLTDLLSPISLSSPPSIGSPDCGVVAKPKVVVPKNSFISTFVPVPVPEPARDPRLNRTNGSKNGGGKEGGGEGGNVGGGGGGGLFGIEVEEISGDESPVMLYHTHLHVEQISSDEGDGETAKEGRVSDDMEISDDDTNQTNVIEVNVRSISKSYTSLPQYPPVPPSLPPLPPTFPLPPAPGYYPPPPPLQSSHPPFLPPLPPHNLLPPTMFPPPLPFPAAQTGTPVQSKLPAALPVNPEKVSQDVLVKALEQLAAIVHKDMERKLVESAAFPELDSYWEKRSSGDSKKEVVRTHNDETGEEERSVKPPEPYRRMLPGMVVTRTEEEEGANETPITPRKKLINFKIPLLNRSTQRRSHHHMARRRLYEDDEREIRRKDGRQRHKRSVRLTGLSDISSEDFSDDDSEEERRRRRRTRTKRRRRSSLSSSEFETSDEEDEILAGPHTPPPEDAEVDISEEEEEEEGEDEESEEKEEEDEEIIMEEEEEEEVNVDDDEDEEEWSLNLELMSRRDTKRRNRRVSSSTIMPDEKQFMVAPEKEKEESKLRTTVNHKIAEPVVEKLIPTQQHQTQARRYMFKKRPLKAEEEILRLFLGGAGVDKEDVRMMRQALVQLIDSGDQLVTNVIWSHYPSVPSYLPPSSKRRKVHPYEDGLHSSGSARCEGYYKIDQRDKSYLPHLRRNTLGLSETTEQQQSKKSGRGNRLNHRRVASLFGSGDMSREVQQYNQLKARKKQLKFAKSTIHNWGLFALENISADEMVIEYVGELVRQTVADDRERRYEAQGIGSSYLFRVDHDYIIDATRRGNMARFINHCCDPNCYARVISIGTQKKIVIYSKRDIAMGEEITYDYKFPIEDEKIPCLCGAPNCRGTLN